MSLMSWCSGGIHPFLARINSPPRVCDVPGTEDSVRKLAAGNLMELFKIADDQLAGRAFFFDHLRRRMRTSSGVFVVHRSSNWICPVSRIALRTSSESRNDRAPRSCLRSKSRCRSSSPRPPKSESKKIRPPPARRRAYCLEGLKLRPRPSASAARPRCRGKASPYRPATAQPRQGTCGPAHRSRTDSRPRT